MKYIGRLIVFTSIWMVMYAQIPNVNLQYAGSEAALNLTGHLQNPHWSVSGNWLGFDLIKKDMVSVVFLSMKTGQYKDYAIGERKSQSSSAYAPSMNIAGANTYNVAWVPSKSRDALYVISSLNKKYELFFIKTIRSIPNDILVYAMNRPETVPNLSQKQISDLSFPCYNLRKTVGTFVASNESSSDIWLILEESNRTKLTQITSTDNTRKYDPQVSVNENGLTEIAYVGAQGFQTDIYYQNLQEKYYYIIL